MSSAPPPASDDASTESESGPPSQGTAWGVSRFVLARTAKPYLGVRAAGAERIDPARGGLLLANHQSFLDPIVLGLPLERSITFLARDTLFRVPGLGRYLRAMKTLPIARDAPATAVMRAALAAIERGELVGLFPEGTRTRDGSLGEIKPGFVAMARRMNAPTYAAGIAGAFESLPRHRKAPIPSPGRVRVVFEGPIREAGFRGEATADVLQTVEAAMAGAANLARRWRETGEPPGADLSSDVAPDGGEVDNTSGSPRTS